MQIVHRILGLFLLLVFVSGCTPADDSKGILGIWRVNSSQVDGREIGDGKGWFDFKADGTVDTRPRPGAYDSGNYEIVQKEGIIKLFSGSGSMNYGYKLEGDKLEMSSKLPTGASLLLSCERVDDYPITKENDIDPANSPFAPPQ